MVCGLRHAAKTGLGNAPFVVYTDDQGQLLDTLPVCQDFSRSRTCPRPTCHLVHLDTDHVETIDGRVTVCRDAAKGSCFRPFCKFYHIPVALPPAGEIARHCRGS
ncbi:hypothetical protein RUM43_008637 [Polyplax serrata]|uniref:C3H1-type domain-containing protein n=1 Tax=Polyplax serrata TaxID=468196 RepID=A0AAN8P650_POLSC